MCCLEEITETLFDVCCAAYVDFFHFCRLSRDEADLIVNNIIVDYKMYCKIRKRRDRCVLNSMCTSFAVKN